MANDATGSFAAPPPGAPHEVAQDLQPDLVAQQVAKARANERALAPFAPPIVTPPAASHPAVPTVPTPAVPPAPSEPSAPPLVLTDAEPTPTPVTLVSPSGNPMPAASDSDTPSRGLPRPIGDPGKVITGGFGALGEAQYFPLDGSELREVVRSLLDQLNTQLENDLHFTMAVTYPRVTVKLTLSVSGYMTEAGFDITKGRAHEKTPEDVAAAHGEPVDHTLVVQKREFTEEGEPEDPPDRMRDALGLEKPRKQIVEQGSQRYIVDRPTSIDSIF